MNKKILILTSSGGGGHISATKALEDYLHDIYTVESLYVFKDLLISLDPFYILSFHKYSGESYYNSFIPKKYFRLLKLFYSFGAWYIQLRKRTIHAKLRDHFIKRKPDLIISVIPLINNIVLDVAEELTIPFLLIPTDLDSTMYIMHIKNPAYKHFYIGITFDNEEIMQPFKNALIPQKQIFVIGAPLRTDFFTPKDKNILKQQLHIDNNKPIIMILMGGRGSCEIEKYATQLLTIDFPLHLLICVGKNGKSKKIITELSIPPHITISIIEFTNNIADYFNVSDILISKSGSQSVCEALYTNTPILLDATSALLPWEAFNHSFIKKHNFGDQITDYTNIPSHISLFIKQPEKLLFYKNNIEKLQKKNCQEELTTLIKKIITKPFQ